MEVGVISRLAVYRDWVYNEGVERSKMNDGGISRVWREVKRTTSRKLGQAKSWRCFEFGVIS